MVLFPEVQRKAQAELDRVVGPNRLPEFNDLEDMPYVRAVAMETTRWMPVTPSGIPHVVTSDDVYNGYHIPKGTAAIPVSHICHCSVGHSTDVSDFCRINGT